MHTHRKVRRGRASGYNGKVDSVDSHKHGFSVHSGTAHFRAECCSGVNELLTLAGNAHEGRQNPANATDEVHAYYTSPYTTI